MERSLWRLIRSAPGVGAWNMAIDEAILESVANKETPPTLRLYNWEPPCLSLGYAQPVGDVDLDALKNKSWHLVRRPTGGRAILHTDELTYAVIAPLEEPRVAGGVLQSYCRLAQALLLGLHLLGLPAQAKKEHNHPTGIRMDGPVCFEAPSNYEITVGGKKLIGSAQARRREGVLQHGALPLYGDITRITQVLNFPNESRREQAAKRLSNHATTVQIILDKVIAWEIAADAFEKGFQQALQLDFQFTELTPSELHRASELVKEKYANNKWTERV